MAIAAKPTFRTDVFIDGDFRPALSGEQFVTEDPARGRVLTEIAAGDAADIDLAVASARRAFDDGRWSRRSPAERKAVLLRLADLIEENAEELALLDSLEAGKPITDCRETDLPETIKTFRWYAEAADKLYDSIAPTGRDALGMIIREPIGVVGAVLPWNFPMMMAAWKAAPALTAGNALVIKPAELTSLSTIRLAELASEAGVPNGVFNVVPGSAKPRARHSGATRTSTCRQLHRLDRGRALVPPLLVGEQPEARRPRMRRQEPAGRDGRRGRPRPGRRERGPRRLREHGRELHLRLAADRPSQRARRAARTDRRQDGRVAGRRPAGPGDPDRPDDRGAASRQGARLHRGRAREVARASSSVAGARCRRAAATSSSRRSSMASTTR